MFKTLKADADCYINNRFINGRICENSNCGQAGTLDMYKLYGVSDSIEYSRALIHFDLSPLFEAYESSSINIDDPSFFVKMKISDVYGGQPTPERFNLKINPLSASFLEGLGRDVIRYEDFDVSNFLTASRDSLGNPISWLQPGCSASGSIGEICDFFTGSFEKDVFFKTGEEDIDVDVTDVVKLMLRTEIPDSGFRISFSPENEEDNRTYFVKRFASRHAFDESKRPKLIFGYDDSIKDTSEFLYTDNQFSFVYYNLEGGALKNLNYSGSDIEGDDCLLLKLTIPPSGAYYFTGSQVISGLNLSSGTYFASGTIPYDSSFIAAQTISGSKWVKAKCEWMSLDENKIFAKLKDRIVLEKPIFESTPISREFTVTTLTESHYDINSNSLVRVNVFDPNSPAVIASRIGSPSPGGYQGVIEDASYRVRDTVTNEILIPFDFEKHSTRLSSDSIGMFFHLDSSNLIKDRTYVIDVALKIGSAIKTHLATSSIFKISVR